MLYRQLRAAVLLVLAASFASPMSVFSTSQQAPPVGMGAMRGMEKGMLCPMGGCGYGLDGFPEPFAGPGFAGRELSDGAAAESLGFGAKNVSLLAWMTGLELSGTPTNANDVWGYTSPSGREYAIVGLANGTAFVDITDPIRPQRVAMIPGSFSPWRDMAVYDEFAYSVNESGDGIQVIDMRRIDRGVVKLRRTINERGLRTSHNIWVNPDSGFAYLLGSNLSRGGLVAVDLADPARPRLEPIAWDTTYVHDVEVVTYTKGRYAGREIAFAFTGPMGLHVIDVTDKSNPTTLSNLRYDNATYGHSGALSPNKRLLYVNDELDERNNTNVSRMVTYVVKVADLEAPRLVRTIHHGIDAVDHNSFIQGDRLFLSAYTAGLRVLRLSKPRRPAKQGFFDTYPASDDAVFAGAWGVYAGFASGNVLITDVQRGLFVLQPR